MLLKKVKELDYYQRKTKASYRITSLIKGSKTLLLANILLIIESEFGLGRKFVLDRLSNMQKAGEILFDKEDGKIERLDP